MTGGRARLTILLVTRRRIARADARPHDAAPEVVSAARRAEDGLAAAVEAALALSSARPGSVWILSDETVVQTVALPAGAVRGLPDEAVSSALALEVQTLSGVTAAGTALGWTDAGEDGGERLHHVVQCGSRDRDEIEAALRRAGARFAGLLHPAGVPSALAVAPPGAWRRVEFWPDVVATVWADGAASPSVRLARTDPARWRDGAQGSVPTSFVAACGIRVPVESASLDDDAVLAAWLGTWTEVLASRAAALPVVRAPERPMSRRGRVLAACGLAVLAATACVLDHRRAHGLRDRLRSEAIAAREPAERLDTVTRGLRDGEARLAELRSAAERAAADAAALAALRTSAARQLRALAERCPPGVVVTAIDVGAERTLVQGTSERASDCDRLAVDLGAALREPALVVSVPVRRARTDGRAPAGYEFDLEIAPAPRPVAPPDAARERP